jgi:pyridinium-3,5-bisthiocarboxylic acid mononucleotide nickel chelatase
MMRIAYFDCFSGISGDMCLAALVSAGWPFERLESLPLRLGLEGVTVATEPARRGPFAAQRVIVTARPGQPHRHLRHVLAMIEGGEIEPATKQRARAVFERLAAAEAAVHGTSVEKVHFHEVGAADALVDVVGAAEGLSALGVERVFASPPRLGGGTVVSEHGPIPVPAPATVELLRGAPVELGPLPVELTTPTGAALLATLVADWSRPPAFRLERVGTGAGTRDPKEWPNVLRLMIGEADAAPSARRRVAVLETALDDENPQVLAALVPGLLAAGALDAMVVPAIMKKGRPGSWLTVIAEPAAADAFAARIMAETSSLGVRLRFDERYELERRIERVETRFGAIEIKVATLPGGGERAVPEFESVRAAAERAARPLREVSEEAVAAWRGRARGDG